MAKKKIDLKISEAYADNFRFLDELSGKTGIYIFYSKRGKQKNIYLGRSRQLSRRLFHHFCNGLALMEKVPRRVKVFYDMDWERACRLERYLIRKTRPAENRGEVNTRSVPYPAEKWALLRKRYGKGVRRWR